MGKFFNIEKTAVSKKLIRAAKFKSLLKNDRADGGKIWWRMRTKSPDMNASTGAWQRLAKSKRDYKRSVRQYNYFSKALKRKK